MDSFSALRIAVVVSACLALMALALQIAKTRSFGRKPLFAPPNGSSAAGIRYALFRGMLPWEKESVAGHLPTFVAGLFYHAGILAGLVSLSLLISRIELSDPLIWTIRATLLVGLGCGIGLLVKRMALAKMRFISTPDDFVSNLLVDLFLAAALTTSFLVGFSAAFMVIATVLFLYIPIGKIRHCAFFFYSRIAFGAFFGRRGVLPPRHPERVK
jgi:hypothetical protein